MTKLLARVKSIFLFLLSPFFALAYMALMPVVGMLTMLRGKDPRVG